MKASEIVRAQIKDTPLYVEQVTDLMKQIILTGEYKPGKRLNEVELSDSLGISRSPIREAIQRLAKEGLVHLVPRKGAFVSTLSVKVVEELFELREALEVMAVDLAADRASKSDIELLSQFLERTHNAIANNEYREYPWNLDFHRRIAEFTRNTRLEEKIYEVNAQLLLVRHRSASELGRAGEAFEEHMKIFKALKKRDGARAKDLMREHIRISRAKVVSLFGTNE